MSAKDINIKNRTYCLFDYIINIKDFNPNNIKLDQQSYKTFLIYYIGYVKIKKDLEMLGLNPLYLIFGKVKGYFEEIYGNKY